MQIGLQIPDSLTSEMAESGKTVARSSEVRGANGYGRAIHLDFRPQVIGERRKAFARHADAQLTRTAYFDIAQSRIGGNKPLIT